MNNHSNDSEETRAATISRRTLLGAAALSGATLIASSGFSQNGQPSEASGSANKTRHRSVTVNGLEIFYREAGNPDAPGVLLLHGFPTSSHMFRHLIPALADNYRVIAPDYPGFGYSSFPSREKFAYSFSAYAKIIAQFTEVVKLPKYTLYIQDYGAPVGLRLALAHPERVTGLIVQNGNAYEEGLSGDWAPIKDYWKNPSPENREKLRGWLNFEGCRLQYVAGIPEEQIELFTPDNWNLDWALLNRPGNIDLQLDLFGDYQTNVALYPKFQAYFRKHQPPTLITWGEKDPFFTRAGAQAFQRDLPNAELHLLNAGHFALESHGGEITALIRAFLAKNLRG